MTKAEIIEYLYDNNVRADITIEQMAEDLADHKTENSSEKPNNCDTCKWGEWYRQGYDITMMSDECGGCCSWRSKWTPKDEQADCVEALTLLWINNMVTDEEYYRIDARLKCIGCKWWNDTVVGGSECVSKECTYQPKDEPFDKDINVRSKDEPQTDCKTCRHWRCNYEECGEIECKYEPKDEPQIPPAYCKACKHDLWSTPRTCGKCTKQEDGKPSMYEPKDGPQTERR